MEADKKKRLKSVQFHQAVTFNTKTILTGIGEIDFKRHGLEMFKTEDGIAVTWGTNEIAIVPMTNVKFYVFEAEKESKDDGNVRNKPANTANKKT